MGTVTGRSQGTENTTSPIHSTRSAKRRNFLGIHDRFIRDAKFRKNMIDNGRTEEICRQMDDLADEDHTQHLTPEEIDDYRSNGWIRSNKIGSDTVPIRQRSDFKQALPTLRQLKDKEDEAQRNQRWTQKLFFVLVELARIMVEFFEQESPRRRTQHRLIRET